MTSRGDINFSWARQLVGALAVAGITRAVISPGSRSTPLTLAALRHPGLRCDVIPDERSAAFFALGLAKASGSPALLIATSGTAVANWLPAVAEANMAGIPMLLLSADRPPELHDCGANQAMDQIHLFGRHVRAFHQLPLAETDADWLGALAGRAVRTSLMPLPGPVHINVPLREPLVPVASPEPAPAPPVPKVLATTARASAEALDEIRRITSAPGGVIVCGAHPIGAGTWKILAALADKRRIPVLADLLSGGRFGPHVSDTIILAHPDQVARGAPVPAWILRLGGTPVTRPVNEWLARCRGVPQIAVSETSRIADATRSATHVLTAPVSSVCDALAGGPVDTGGLADQFLARDRAAAAEAGRLCASAAPFEGSVLRAVLAGMPEQTPVFIGNSLALRAAEWFAGRGTRHLRILGNRGVSGIDGNISTACGIAATQGPTLAIVGDLTLFHDLNALGLVARHPLTVMVLDNGGGGIFEHLAEGTLPEFETGWRTPQAVDFVGAARAFGLETCRPGSAADAARDALDGIVHARSRLIHVPIDPAASLAVCREFFATALAWSTRP